MADTVEIISRRLSKSGRERVYSARGKTTEAAAIAAVLAVAPANLDGFELTDFSGQENAIENLYEVTVIYGEGDKTKSEQGGSPETGSSSFEFSIGVENVRVWTPPSGGTIEVFGPVGVPAENFPTVEFIGDTGVPDETPPGVEIMEPTYDFSERHFVAASAVDATFKNTLKSLVGRVNNEPFKGHGPYEVLAVGVSGQQRAVRDDWELSFSFKVRDNQYGLTIGTTTYDKLGWQYAWPMRDMYIKGRYFESYASFVCVSDVYKSANFAAFGIGTT